MKELAEIYKPMTTMIDMVASGHSNSLILHSEGGMGKTYNVVSHLKSKNINYKMFVGYNTPLQFYIQLYENRDSLIILDDVEGLLEDAKGLSILKSALWSVDDERVVSYSSSTQHLEGIPSSFIFTGKIIFTINHFPKRSSNFNAMQSRCLFYSFRVGFEDKIHLLREISKKPYKQTTQKQRDAVLQYISENCNEATENLNIRTMLHLFDAYAYSIEAFEQVANELLITNQDLNIVLELFEHNVPEKEKVRMFRELTGKSRATYFNMKKQVRERQSKSPINLADLSQPQSTPAS